MNLMSSTLLLEDTGVPFDELQAEQIAIFREAWAAAGSRSRLRGKNLVVMNTCSRGTPLSRRPWPTLSSLPYACAVSMCR